jgi:S1-C subfamily serine protease
MAYFENKAEYLKWAKKRESRRLPKAATKESLPENLGIFHKAKVYLTKSPISWIFPILGVVLILSLYSLNSGKGQNPGPGKDSTSHKTEWIPPGSLSQPVKLQNLDLGKVNISNASLHLNSIPGGANGQNIEPENANISLEDTLQKASRALVFIKTAQGKGCGFLLSNRGLIVTNAHIIGRSDEAEIFFHSGAGKRGVVLKKLPLPLDIALLQIDGDDFEPLPLANSHHCQEGEEIVALGFPGGENWGSRPTLSKGSIRSCNKSYEDVQYLQIDGAIHPDNNGGPILNQRGEVIGLSKGEFRIKGLEGSLQGLSINVVKASLDQKLTQLEERIREREKFFKYVYDDLWVTVSSEYQIYQKQLSLQNDRGVISAQEAYRLEKRPFTPPAGYPSLKNWVADLTERVVKGELTKEKAISIVKDHFALNSIPPSDVLPSSLE